MSFFASLASKIMVLVLVLAGGVGFLLGQSNIRKQVSVENDSLKVASTSSEASEVSQKPVSSKSSSPVASSSSSTAQTQGGKKVKENSIAPKASVSVVAAPQGPFAFDSAWREAIVNLYCTVRYGDSLEDLSSGSGVMIDPRGIILTNAHVGEDFLFADWPNPSLYNCSVRVGSPAEPRYRAKLLYIPSEWVAERMVEIGTIRDKAKNDEYVKKYIYGKNDYALLYITKTIDSQATLPASFPFLPLYTGPISPPGSSMYMAGYPGSFLGGIAVSRNLSLIASPTVVDSVRSIKGNSTLDILAFKGIIAGQHGTSGGAVINAGGKFTAIPTFFDTKEGDESGQGETTSDNVMNTITLEYVSRDLKADTGFSLEEFIARENPQAISNQFMSEVAPAYQQRYVDAWKKMNLIVPGTY